MALDSKSGYGETALATCVVTCSGVDSLIVISICKAYTESVLSIPVRGIRTLRTAVTKFRPCVDQLTPLHPLFLQVSCFTALALQVVCTGHYD